MKIDDIPDFPALRQVQGALWGAGETRGAAVLVGAGFSRCAELPAHDSRMPPLFGMAKLAVAEEVCAYAWQNL